jgi:DNA-binding response OmpR family regulator
MDNLKPLNILFLEDNKEFAKNTVELLNMFFNNVFHARSIKQSLKLYKNNHIDIIISDIKVEDGNGLDFIRAVRKLDSSVLIVVLSAHKDEDFLFKAIPLNITSYELKPLSYDKFMSLLKKLSLKFNFEDEVSITDNIIYNYREKLLYVDEKPVVLTKKEILFMELMIKNRGKIVTSDMIQEYVWANKPMTEPGLKNLIFRLRNKTDKKFIVTVQSVGYKLTLTK